MPVLRDRSRIAAAIFASMPINIPLALWVVFGSGGPAEPHTVERLDQPRLSATAPGKVDVGFPIEEHDHRDMVDQSAGLVEAQGHGDGHAAHRPDLQVEHGEVEPARRVVQHLAGRMNQALGAPQLELAAQPARGQGLDQGSALTFGLEIALQVPPAARAGGQGQPRAQPQALDLRREAVLVHAQEPPHRQLLPRRRV